MEVSGQLHAPAGPIYNLLQYSLKDKEVIKVFLILPEECTFLVMVVFFARSHYEF
jgi:hypothetical protein